MGVQNLTIAVGATSMAVTGGTSRTFSPDGQDVKNGIHIIDVAETDFRVQKNILLKTRNPSLQPNGSWSKAKRTIDLYIPKILSDGSQSFTVGRLTLEFHPETTAAERTDLRLILGQLCTDTDLDSFVSVGSLS